MAAHRGHWTYTSYEAILVHMDAFSRFQISRCCPGFQNLDNILPVKINKLRIGLNLHVDDVEIKIETIRQRVSDSEERQKVWRDLQRAQAELEKQKRRRILKYAADKRKVKKLKSSITRLKREHAKLKPKTIVMFQAVGIRKNNDQHGIGTVVTPENMWIGPERKYFTEKFFKENYRINTVDAGSYASMWFHNPDFQINFALLKTAKLLIVNDCFFMSPHSFVALPHKRVYWNRSQPINGLLELLISEWQRNNLPIGKRFTVPKELKRNVGVQFEFIEMLPGARIGMIKETRGTRFPNCVTFPLTNDTELNVYCLDTQEGEEYDEQQVYWNVEIHSKGHAERL